MGGLCWTRVFSNFFFLDSYQRLLTVYSSLIDSRDSSMFIYPDKHTMDRCQCPFCDNLFFRSRVSYLLTSMPHATYTQLLELMIRPFLRSLSDLLPSLFPIEWISNPPVARLHLDGSRDLTSLRSLYLGMCVSASSIRVGCDACVDVSQLVFDIGVSGESIFSRLLVRRRFIQKRGFRSAYSFRVCVTRIMAQIDSIRGVDVIFNRLRVQIEALNGKRMASYTPSAFCRFACRVGMVERTLSLAHQFKDECDISRQSRSYLYELIIRLNEVVRTEQQVRLAVAMALHSRLGASSGLGLLGGDLLPLCIQSPVCKPIRSWHSLIYDA